MLRLPRNESFRLHLREWDLAIPDLPEPLEGLQIVQISDLHIAPCFDRRVFRSRRRRLPATGMPIWSS